MVDLFETYFAYDAATPAEQAALRDAVAADPALAKTLRILATAERSAADACRTLLPDRSVLVLLALDRAGYALDADDAERLSAARPALDRLRVAVPATEAVLDRIADDAALFDLCWNEAPEAPAQHDTLKLSRSTPLRSGAFDGLPPAPRPAAARGRLRRAAWRVSLVFTLVLMAVVTTLLVRRDAHTVTHTASAAETLQLPDGSSVRLRPGATLAYAEASAGPRRTVTLTGDAVFDVATTGVPFVVETPSGRVVVTGTVFGVRATADATEVTLVEGQVLLSSRGAASGVTLAPGQQSRVVPGALPTTPSEIDLAGEMAWSGRFYFRDTPLREVAERLSAHYRTPVAVAPHLAAERVNGEFEDTTPVRDILNALASSLPKAQVAEANGGFRLF